MARPVMLLLASLLPLAELLPASGIHIAPGSTAQPIAVDTIERGKFVSKIGRPTLVFVYDNDDAFQRAMFSLQSIKDFLQQSPHDVDYLFIPGTSDPGAAEMRAKQWFLKFTNAMADLNWTQQQKNERWSQLHFSVNAQPILDGTYGDLLQDWTGERKQLVVSMAGGDKDSNTTIARLDAQYDWLPAPPAAAAGLPITHVSSPCWRASYSRVHGTWAVAANSSICSYETMIRYAQDAGALGVIVIASQESEVEMMTPDEADESAAAIVLHQWQQQQQQRQQPLQRQARRVLAHSNREKSFIKQPGSFVQPELATAQHANIVALAQHSADTFGGPDASLQPNTDFSSSEPLQMWEPGYIYGEYEDYGYGLLEFVVPDSDLAAAQPGFVDIQWLKHNWEDERSDDYHCEHGCTSSGVSTLGMTSFTDYYWDIDDDDDYWDSYIEAAYDFDEHQPSSADGVPGSGNSVPLGATWQTADEDWTLEMNNQYNDEADHNGVGNDYWLIMGSDDNGRSINTLSADVHGRGGSSSSSSKTHPAGVSLPPWADDDINYLLSNGEWDDYDLGLHAHVRLLEGLLWLVEYDQVLESLLAGPLFSDAPAKHNAWVSSLSERLQELEHQPQAAKHDCYGNTINHPKLPQQMQPTQLPHLRGSTASTDSTTLGQEPTETSGRPDSKVDLGSVIMTEAESLREIPMRGASAADSISRDSRAQADWSKLIEDYADIANTEKRVSQGQGNGDASVSEAMPAAELEEETELIIPATMISHHDGHVLLSMLSFSPASVTVQFQTVKVLGSFFGINAAGQLMELGWAKTPTLMHLAWQAQWEVYSQELQQRLQQPAHVLDIFDNAVIEGEHGVAVNVRLPAVLELRKYSTLELDFALGCPGDKDEDCPAWDHVVQLFACCEAHCKPCPMTPYQHMYPARFDQHAKSHQPLHSTSGNDDMGACGLELGRWVTPFRRRIGHWLTDVSPLMPIVAPQDPTGMCTFRIQTSPWAGPWTATLKLRFLNTPPAAAATATATTTATTTASATAIATPADAHPVLKPQSLNAQQHQHQHQHQQHGQHQHLHAHQQHQQQEQQETSGAVAAARKLLAQPRINAAPLSQEPSHSSIQKPAMQQQLQQQQQQEHQQQQQQQEQHGTNMKEVHPAAKPHQSPPLLLPLFQSATFDHNYNSRPPASFRTPYGLKQALMVAVITGHGSDNFNCAEFCPGVAHHFSVNGATSNLTLTFPDAGTPLGCANRVLQGSVPNEHGTWLYGRNGWCDGQQVTPWVVDITHLLAVPGAKNSIVYKGTYHGKDPQPTENPGYIMMQAVVSFNYFDHA